MKPIDQMTLPECIEALGIDFDDTSVRVDLSRINLIADRIHDLTRWVPVSERMPTEEDGLNLSDGLCVLVKSAEIPSWHRIVPYSRANSLNGYSHWRRITPPEDKL
jgi:hypothetical protein